MDMHMHTHKHTKSDMIAEIPSVFPVGFFARKNILSQRFLVADFVAENIPSKADGAAVSLSCKNTAENKERHQL